MLARRFFYLETADKTVSQIGVDFFVRTRWKTGRRVVLCGGFSAEVRAKKMRWEVPIKWSPSNWCRFFVLSRRQTGRIAEAMWRICRYRQGEKDVLRRRCWVYQYFPKMVVPNLSVLPLLCTAQTVHSPFAYLSLMIYNEDDSTL